jgi:WD repeat-containing protein 19
VALLAIACLELTSTIPVQVAHARLCNAIDRIRQESEPALETLLANLAIIHSYVLVKHKVQADQHLDAARLLIRVCNNISRFEKHAVQILTSAVIECQRAGLPQSAFELATKLMQPQYQEGLQKMGAHKRKIEGIVRFASSCDCVCGYSLRRREADY